MKHLTKTTHYFLLKPVNQDSKYFFVRVWTEGLNRHSWAMGYENDSSELKGFVSFVGPTFEGEKAEELEKEYQKIIKKESNDSFPKYGEDVAPYNLPNEE